MTQRHWFRVADIAFSITFEHSETIQGGDNKDDKEVEGGDNGMSLLPSFAPFCAESDSEALFHITVKDSLPFINDGDLIRRFDTGNGFTSVYKLSNGGYQFLIRDIYNKPCCLLQTDLGFKNCCCALKGTHTMRAFGLNNAMMLTFAFAGSYKQALLIHASCVMNNGFAYPFIAKSGTGKSTHSSLWLKHIEGTELMNDDNPVVRIVDGKAILYGSPWSGKTPCYKNISAPLGAIVRIERALENSIERLNTANAFASFLPSCSSMKWDAEVYDNICNAVSEVIRLVPAYTLHCLPDEGAALLCKKTVSTQSN